MMDTEKILSRMVQTGIVSATNPGNNTARVILDNTDIISGWLKVISGMPKVGQAVLVLYLPIVDGDGFILGVI